MLEVAPRSRKDAQIGMSENIYTSAVVFSWKLYIARGTSIAATLVLFLNTAQHYGAIGERGTGIAKAIHS